MRNLRSGLIAIVSAVLLGIGLWYFDGTILLAAQKEASQQFRMDGVAALFSIGYLLIGGCSLLAASAVWTSRSVLAGFVYLVVGLGIALLSWLALGLMTCTLDGTSCVGTFPIFADWYFTLASGPLHAVLIFAAAAGWAGAAALLRIAVSRRATAS